MGRQTDSIQSIKVRLWESVTLGSKLDGGWPLFGLVQGSSRDGERIDVSESSCLLPCTPRSVASFARYYVFIVKMECFRETHNTSTILLRKILGSHSDSLMLTVPPTVKHRRFTSCLSAYRATNCKATSLHELSWCLQGHQL
jgi:hypothetical protein